MENNNIKFYFKSESGEYIPLCQIEEINQVDFDLADSSEIQKPFFPSTAECSFTFKQNSTQIHFMFAKVLMSDIIKRNKRGSKLWHLAVNSKKSRVRKKAFARLLIEDLKMQTKFQHKER